MISEANEEVSSKPKAGDKKLSGIKWRHKPKKVDGLIASSASYLISAVEQLLGSRTYFRVSHFRVQTKLDKKIRDRLLQMNTFTWKIVYNNDLVYYCCDLAPILRYAK